jgi:cell wall-associated NlpC family hydrolase
MGKAWVVVGTLLLLACCACTRRPAAEAPRETAARRPLAPGVTRLGWSIQAGAFANVENAVRLAEKLQALGENATWYASGPEITPRLYRVRFGNFPGKEAARARALEMRASGLLSEFYLVAPEEPALPRARPEDEDGLRANLVDTAGTYLGVPYLWGGTNEQGFDCSGLTMAVYRLNGLQIPRSSREQFKAGTPVEFADLRKGDLVFFHGRGSTISHVGIYAGGDVFIHAPRRGRNISREKLTGYYRDHFAGARSYI